MNSLPLISHRLIAAAIGNESRAARERPRWPERPSVQVEEQATLIALATADNASKGHRGLRFFQPAFHQPRV
jgi:hypothetical protein